jgi:hypothetical protein
MRIIKIKSSSEIPSNYTGIVEYNDGSKEWYLNDELHRVDGPAVEKANGIKIWYLNGKYHRVNGPAIEYPNGTKSWYLNDQLHREDGPAVENFSGRKAWYLNGEFLFRLLPESQPFVFLEEFVDGEGEERIKVLTQDGIETWPDLPGLKELAENWEKKLCKW